MTLITNIDAPPQPDGGKWLKTSYASFQRDTSVLTAYAVGDVISDDEGVAKAIQFPGCGRSGKVMRVHVTMEDTATANLELWIFDREPKNHADNAPLALLSADMLGLLGVVKLNDGDKVNATTVGDGIEFYRASLDTSGTGELAYVTANTEPRGTLYGLLVTRSAFTGVADGKFHIRLGLEPEMPSS